MSDSDIKQYLRSLPSGEPLCFVPNPGNAGDSLIAHATFQLFRELQIEYCLFDGSNSDPAEKVVVYAGGGNLVRYYENARPVIQRIHRSAKKLVLLPHTIEGNEDLLGRLGRNVDIICREEISYRHVRQHAPNANAFLMDDMAFNLNLDQTLAEKPLSLPAAVARKVAWRLSGDDGWQPQPPPSVLLKDLRFVARCRLDGLRALDGGILNCFRTDVERTGPVPDDNLDLSSIFGYGTKLEKMAAYSSYRLLSFLKHYKEVRTNRLHICIAGALLGMSVRFHPNASYKCQAVYDFSINGRYPSVQWVGR